MTNRYEGWIKGGVALIAVVAVGLAIAALAGGAAVADNGLQEQIDALVVENESLSAQLVSIERQSADVVAVSDDIEAVSAAVASLGDDIATLNQRVDTGTANLDRRVDNTELRVVDLEQVSRDQQIAINGAYAAADDAYNRAMNDTTSIVAGQIYGDLGSLERCVNSNLSEIAKKWNRVASANDFFGFSRLRLTSC